MPSMAPAAHVVETALRHTTIAIVPGEAVTPPPALCCLHSPTRPPVLHYNLSMLQCRFPHSISWSPMVGAQGIFPQVVVRLQAMATTSSHIPICQEQCGIQGLAQCTCAPQAVCPPPLTEP